MIGTLLDIHTINEEKSIIELTFKNEDQKIIKITDTSFKPYFYLLLKNNLDLLALEKDKSKYEIINIETIKNFNNIQIKKFVRHTLNESDLENNNYLTVKIYFDNIQNLIKCRQEITSEIYFSGKFEYDIPFDIRYAIDKQIKPLYKYEFNKNFEFKEIEEDNKYNLVAIDIETKSCNKDPEKNEIIMIGLYSPELNIKKIITSGKSETKLDFAEIVDNEKQLIEEFIKTIKDNNIHFIATYNGDNFDLPFIRKRTKILGLIEELDSVLKYTPHTLNNNTTCYTDGIQHIDTYKIVQYLNNIGAINLTHLKLNDVYNYLFNKSKIDLKYEDFETYYNDPKLINKLIEYNLVDIIATYDITTKFLTQFIKLSQISGKTIQETNRSSSSNLVESLLMYESVKNKSIIPNKPREDLAILRSSQSYEGGYVKEPTPGMHENICVLDFQSFHPSIIITFNISPETLNVNNCKIQNSIVEGESFCKDSVANIPKILSEILDKRLIIKNELKTKSKDSLEYKILYAQQWSLKILLNSMYGYLAYSRARWYCFECAKSTLKYTHKFIYDVIEKAQENGFTVIYGDTDSCFITYNNKDSVKQFLEGINKELPGKIHLTLDNYYKRGIFVEKKQTEGTAKKRYALIDENNNIKITGFETVRRDWSNLAKDTQKSVLETILKTGNIDDAANIVKKTIKNIREHNVKKEDLIIINKIRKSIEGYNATGPHVSAALKAKSQGYNFEGGETIEYIITNTGKTISEKAQLAELTKENDYDIDYYINNQVLPSVISIFNVFNYDENKLLNRPTQKKLF